MYKRICIFFCFLLFGIAIYAQPALDTIKDCLKQKPHLLVKLDSRNSFISNSRARIFGAKLGLNYGGRLHFGIGYNQLYAPAKDFNKQVYYGLRDSVTAKLHLFYISAYAEYIFYQNKHWELSMPLQIGIGKTYYTYELFGQKREREENLNFIYEPAVSVGYKFVKWFGLGADIGFRFMVTGDKRLTQKFTAPTYAFKLLIFYSEIYKALFPKNRSE